MSLYCFSDEEPDYASDGEVFKINKPWQENEVTWIKTDTDSSWTNPGVDFVESPVYTLNRTDINVTDSWEDYDVTATIKEFLQNPESNHGFLIRINPGDKINYYSSEFSQVLLRPKLIITEEAINIQLVNNQLNSYNFDFHVTSNYCIVEFEKTGPFKIGMFNIMGRKLWDYKANVSHAGSYWIKWNRENNSQTVLGNQIKVFRLEKENRSMSKIRP